MRTKFFCTSFLNTARGPGHPGKIPGTSRIPLFETQGRQSFEGGHEVFGHHPFAWKTPTPPGGLRTQKLNLCALFSCLKLNTTFTNPAKERGSSIGRSKLFMVDPLVLWDAPDSRSTESFRGRRRMSRPRRLARRKANGRRRTPRRPSRTFSTIAYKHPVLTLYGYGKILTEGISLIF